MLALAGGALDGDYPPVLACEDSTQVTIEELAIGRRDFEAERVVAVPHDLPPNLARRDGDEARKQLTFAINDGPRLHHTDPIFQVARV